MLEMGGERYEWLRLFDPCSVRVSQSHKLVRCANHPCVMVDNARLPCFKLAAFETAKKILGGATDEDVRVELTDYVFSLVGDRVIGVDGNDKRVKKKTAANDKGDIRRRACDIVKNVRICGEETKFLSQEALSALSHEQRDAICNVQICQYAIEVASEANMTVAIEKMRMCLREALLLNTKKFSLIARLAITYGLAAEVPQGNVQMIRESPIRLVVVPAN